MNCSHFCPARGVRATQSPQFTLRDVCAKCTKHTHNTTTRSGYRCKLNRRIGKNLSGYRELYGLSGISDKIPPTVAAKRRGGVGAQKVGTTGLQSRWLQGPTISPIAPQNKGKIIGMSLVTPFNESTRRRWKRITVNCARRGYIRSRVLLPQDTCEVYLNMMSQFPIIQRPVDDQYAVD